jgi:pyruvate formate-lyase activating enzyme-like uncharacterized protein
MSKIINWLNESIYIKPLSIACKMCAEGSKMVLLITGLCPASCFYCPLSNKKIRKDKIFADEWKLSNENDTQKLLLEAKYIQAKGAGITGGDPLIKWKRTKEYISLLKNEFGSDFHIHLYTSGLKNCKYIGELVAAGLDEIRFHPMFMYWKKMQNVPFLKYIKKSLVLDCDVAFEIPSIPGFETDIFSIIKWAYKNDISWINLNELEYSETNAKELNNKDFTVKDDISSAVKNSQQTAYNVIKKVVDADLKIGVHYCSSSFKDGIQLRNRIKRRAENIARKGDIITDDGTLLKGIIVSKNKSLKKIYNLLVNNLKIQKKYINIDLDKKRIELAIWVLKKNIKFFKKNDIDCFIIEEYPTADRLEVEKIPLN